MAVIFTRLYRCVIIRQFGSLRNALTWLFAVVLTVYLLDNYVFTKHQLQVLMGEKSANKPNDVLQNLAVEKEPVVPASKVELASPPLPSKVVPNPVEIKAGDVVQPVVQPVPAIIPNPPKPELARKKCTVACPLGQISYYLKSGKDRDISPTMCFDGNYVMSQEKSVAKRGINVVILNNDTFEVVDTRTFDVYEDDKIMIRYLKLAVQPGHLILAATLDEASFHLTNAGRQGLHPYGSVLIDKLGFRDNFVMIGQYGLEQSKAIENVLSRKEGSEFGQPVEISGCLRIPIAKITPITISEDEREILNGGLKLGKDKPNCGVKEPCQNNSFSVQMFTGLENKYMAKICVNGKYVFGEGLNDAGRGLNIAVVSPKTMDVIRVGHFDTFGADSSNLEIFMEMLTIQDIVIVVSYDESSKNFDIPSQKLFQAIGSSFANKLIFRDAWVFVGQQGMEGYSEIEEISPVSGNWPKPIDKILCVPTFLKGQSTPLREPVRTRVW